MTEFEIVQMYKQAKDKNKQIEILADLELVSQKEIIEILSRNGAISGIKKTAKTKKSKRAQRFDWTDERVNRLVSLHTEGYSSSEIAELMGLDYRQVQNKLGKMKLRANAPKKSASRDEDVEQQYIHMLEKQLKDEAQQREKYKLEIESLVSENTELKKQVENNADCNDLKAQLKEMTLFKEACRIEIESLTRENTTLKKKIEDELSCYDGMYESLDDAKLLIRLVYTAMDNQYAIGAVQDALIRAESIMTEVMLDLK